MSRAIRRLHRKQTKFTNFSGSEAAELPEVTETIEESIELARNDKASEESLTTSHSMSISTKDTSSIRAEFLEDNYHSQLCESDFSDDTHDWGNDNESASSDYWHFLGQYE